VVEKPVNGGYLLDGLFDLADQLPVFGDPRYVPLVVVERA